MEGLNNKQFSKRKENFLWLVRLEKKSIFKNPEQKMIYPLTLYIHKLASGIDDYSLTSSSLLNIHFDV